MIRLILSSLTLLSAGTCLSIPNHSQEPISIYGFVDGGCIDTGKCIPIYVEVD